MTSNNPFFEESPLPYHAPDFRCIKVEHYGPAIELGMAEQQKEIDAIVRNPDPPTFSNTIEALEGSGELLDRTLKVFMNLCAAHTSPEMQALQGKYAPLLSAHEDAIYMNDGLFHRVKAVQEKESNRLAGEEKRLLEVLLRNFSMAGAHLGAAEKKSLMEVNQRLAALTTEFGDALLEARKTGSLLIHDEKELAGLPAEVIETAKTDAKKFGHPEGTYLLLLINTVQQPLMEQLTDRETRRRLLEASLTRAVQTKEGGVNTTRLVEEMTRLRLQKAKLMGFRSFAEWKLQDQMANPSSAKALLKEVSGHAIAKAEEEAAEIRQYMKDSGVTHSLEAWDWCYYQERVRQKKYALDDRDVKPYMELFTVLEQGVMFAASELYGIEFKKRTDLPTYDLDVVCYEVLESSNHSPLGLFFFDPYARESKRGGAWMTDFVTQSTRKNQRPVIYNVLNIEKPPAGQPTLLTSDHLRTIFHEFGHALHGMLAMQKYGSLSGTSVSRDFVEFPSQINEKWALHDKVLRHYAVHYQTKQPIPNELVEKMKASERFGVGFSSTELMKASVVDLAWHLVESEKDFLPVAEMEEAALAEYGLTFPLIPPRYISSIFAHIFAGGYSAGYYAYTWAKVLDCDGFEYFQEHGGLTRKNGLHFREAVLSVGNSKDLNEVFRQFAGRDPSIGAYLRLTGLKGV